MSTDNPNDITLVIDDLNLQYNITHDETQLVAPSSLISRWVDVAKESAWGETLTVITAPSVSFSQNVTGVQPPYLGWNLY